MKSRKILLRFDDVCPTMSWEQWEKAMQLLNEIDASALIGVIPDCKDPMLHIDAPRSDFWEYIRQLQKRGFTIAMHGLHHKFSTISDGIVTKHKISEFAGLPYELQLEKIRRGKAILNAQGVDTDVFFAPAHSYDDNTLRALADCGFKYISDGYSYRPYCRHGIICLPCTNGGIPKINGWGNYTAVIHSHEWLQAEKTNEFIQLQQLCAKHQNEIVSFEDFCKWKEGYAPIQQIIENLHLFIYRYIIPILVKIKHLLLRYDKSVAHI